MIVWPRKAGRTASQGMTGLGDSGGRGDVGGWSILILGSMYLLALFSPGSAAKPGCGTATVQHRPQFFSSQPTGSTMLIGVSLFPLPIVRSLWCFILSFPCPFSNHITLLHVSGLYTKDYSLRGSLTFQFSQPQPLAARGPRRCRSSLST